MVIELSLATLAIAMVVLAVSLAVAAFRSKKAIQLIQLDVHRVAQETTELLSTIDDFIHTDLHLISKETNQAITNVTSLSSDVKNKVNSLNFLFRPFSFLNSKLGSELPSEPSHHCDTVPQILKWIASTVLLIKTTKELIKHDK